MSFQNKNVSVSWSVKTNVLSKTGQGRGVYSTTVHRQLAGLCMTWSPADVTVSPHFCRKSVHMMSVAKYSDEYTKPYGTYLQLKWLKLRIINWTEILSNFYTHRRTPIFHFALFLLLQTFNISSQNRSVTQRSIAKPNSNAVLDASRIYTIIFVRGVNTANWFCRHNVSHAILPTFGCLAHARRFVLVIVRSKDVVIMMRRFA